MLVATSIQSKLLIYFCSLSTFLSITQREREMAPPKLDRKTVERNRRNHMKALCFKLVSLIPPQHLKTSKGDQLDQASSYIRQLRERIEKLKEKKEQEMKLTNTNSLINNNNNNNPTNRNGGSRFPLVELRYMGSSIEVLLISGLQKNFMLYEVIAIIEEEGAEVISASFSTVGDKVFHTIHAQVKISRLGVEPSRVSQRLKDLIY